MARRRKKRTHVPTESEAAVPPRSFVVRSGDVGRVAGRLVHDMRKVMAPNTAAKLKERSANRLRDYVAMAGPLHVSHLLVVSRAKPRGRGGKSADVTTDAAATGAKAGSDDDGEDDDGKEAQLPANGPPMPALSLRVGALPRGPTAAFRIHSYSLAADIAAMLKTPKALAGGLLQSAPLLVLNNFPTDRPEFKLLSTILVNMFPALQVAEMKLGEARRVVLFNYNDVAGRLDFRHYAIDVKTAGVSRGIKKIVNQKHMPDLSRFNDISEYITRESMAADSDVEDAEPGDTTVTLAHNCAGRNNRKSEQRAIKLTELGPRMELELIKIQEGLCSGDVLYHKYVKKSPEEVAALRARKAARDAEKARRRREQEMNVARKREAKEARRQRRREQREAEGQEGELVTDSDSEEEYGNDDNLDNDDDFGAEYSLENGSDDDEIEAVSSPAETDSDEEEWSRHRKRPRS